MIRQDDDHKAEAVLFERNALQGRLEATAPQLSGIRSSLTVAGKQRMQHCGLSAAIHLPLESLLYLSFSRFVDGVACLISNNGAVDHARLKFVIDPEFECAEVDSRFGLRLLQVTERCGKVSTARLQASVFPPSMSLVPGNDSSESQSWFHAFNERFPKKFGIILFVSISFSYCFPRNQCSFSPFE